MAALSLKKKVKYFPSIPGNRDLPEAERLTLLITSGMPKLERDDFYARAELMADAEKSNTIEGADDLEKSFEGVVELVPSETTIEGKKMTRLADYLLVISSQPGAPFLDELTKTIVWNNSARGNKELFSEPLPGGTASTASRNATATAR